MGLFDWFGKKQLQEDTEEGSQVQVVRLNMDTPVGSSGTEIFSGYFSEEYLFKLQGSDAADVYDKMRRSDPVIKMCLRAVKNPLRAATWEVRAQKDADKKQEEIAEFVKWNLFEGLTKSWQKTLNDVLSVIDFGHSVLEMVDGTMFDHPEFKTKSIIRQLGWRSQKSLYEWKINQETGLLETLEQIAEGDTMRANPVRMDAKNLMLFTIDQEGDNYEGESMLRACYGSWLRKQMFLKLEAIGIEKTAIPTPTGKIPKGKENTPQRAAFEAMLKNLTSHNMNYALIPEGWEIDFLKNDFDPQKLRVSIDKEDQSIMFAFLANFLGLGASKGGSSGGGSYALGQDLSDFFLGGVQYVGDVVCDEFNRRGGPIQRIVDRNFGPQAKYPQLNCSGITDKAGKEFGEVMSALSSSGIIQPDDKLEEAIRKRFKLPEMDQDTTRIKPNPAPIPPGKPTSDPGNVPDDDDDPKPPKPIKKKASETAPKIRLADRAQRMAPRRMIREQAAVLEDLMQESLGGVASEYVDRIMREWRQLGPDSKLDAIRKAKIPGGSDYKKTLFAQITIDAAEALAGARAEVPTVTKVKLSEFENLPKKTQKKLKQRSETLVESQMADLDKAVTFQFENSVDNSMGSESVLRVDLEDAAETYIEGPASRVGGTNTAAFVVNEARNSFFFDEDVLKAVQSFTFINSDPVSPICTDLAGTTFEYGDPAFSRYYPPLHHNCKSFLSANLSPRPISPNGLIPSDPALDKFITLSE